MLYACMCPAGVRKLHKTGSSVRLDALARVCMCNVFTGPQTGSGPILGLLQRGAKRTKALIFMVGKWQEMRAAASWGAQLRVLLKAWGAHSRKQYQGRI